jgi:hypothetical protein
MIKNLYMNNINTNITVDMNNLSLVGGLKFVENNMPIMIPYIIFNFTSSILGIIGLYLFIIFVFVEYLVKNM